MTDDPARFDAWHPGLESEIPVRLRSAMTLFRPEHATIAHREARELADFSGLDVHEIHAFRAERLLVHELLIRVTGELSVPDGPAYDVLGRNLRAMVTTIHERHVAPALPALQREFDSLRSEAGSLIERELMATGRDAASDRASDDVAGATSASRDPTLRRRLTLWLERLLGSGSAGPASPPVEAEDEDPLARIHDWASRRDAREPGLERACLDALATVATTIVGHRGRLPVDTSLIARLARERVCNTFGSERLGAALDPIFREAVETEGYRRLPTQQEPVVLNVKGASAAGKSTIRPLQRALAVRLGLDWRDFALISPDYWRKYLLDYDSLGDDDKYAAMLTGHELAIIDQKLDRHIARLADTAGVPHLLIDRFRFDSFVLPDGRAAGSTLLSRFGQRVFLFFMITPPAETVTRAWARGHETGRYKAVDDLLHHNVEAYTGMPALFLAWIGLRDREVHVEFLDNDVLPGERPRTVAYGRNGRLTVLDVDKLADVDRYRRLRVESRNPEALFESVDLALESNLEFLRACVAEIPAVHFVDPVERTIQACFEDGRLVAVEPAVLAARAHDDALRTVLGALGMPDDPRSHSLPAPDEWLDDERSDETDDRFTIGR